MCGWYLSPHPPLAGCPGARSSRCSNGDRLIGEPVGASYGYVHRWRDTGASVSNERRSFEGIAGCGPEASAPRKVVWSEMRSLVHVTKNRERWKDLSSYVGSA